MGDNSKKPGIRFKGFTDDWEQRKLGDVVIDHNAGIYISKEDYGKGTNVIGVGNIYDSDIFDGEIYRLGPVNDDKFILEENDIIYGESSIVPEGIARTVCIGKNGAGSAFAWHTRRVKLDKNVVNSHVATLELNYLHDIRKYLVSVSTQTALTGMTTDGYFGATLTLPSIQEQQKISDYFKQLDHLITLHQRKYDKLVVIKKSMLEKMFPKDGQTKPEIRFSGFTDDWEQRKFADYYKMSSGYAFKMTDYCDDGAGLINGESIQHGIINDDNLNHLPESFIEQYPEFVLKEGDIVVGLNRPITNGNLKIARIPSKYNNFMLYQRAGKIVYKAGCDKDFSYILLSQEILKHTLVEAVGSDQPFISTSKLDKWKIMMPMNIEEQEKIGVYFSNLDHIITLHQRELEKLKKIKLSMLEKMFV